MSRGKKMEVSIGLGHQKFLVAASFLAIFGKEMLGRVGVGGVSHNFKQRAIARTMAFFNK